MIFGREVACLAAWSTRSCSGKPMWPGIHKKVTEVLLVLRRSSRINRIRWEIGLDVYGSAMDWSDERESVRIKYLFWVGR